MSIKRVTFNLDANTFHTYEVPSESLTTALSWSVEVIDKNLPALEELLKNYEDNKLNFSVEEDLTIHASLEAMKAKMVHNQRTFYKVLIDPALEHLYPETTYAIEHLQIFINRITQISSRILFVSDIKESVYKRGQSTGLPLAKLVEVSALSPHTKRYFFM